MDLGTADIEGDPPDSPDLNPEEPSETKECNEHPVYGGAYGEEYKQMSATCHQLYVGLYEPELNQVTMTYSPAT